MPPARGYVEQGADAPFHACGGSVPSVTGGVPSGMMHTAHLSAEREEATVRKSVLISGVVVAALALSACGSSPAAKKAALKQFVGSIGSSPYVQMKFTSSFKGAGVTAKTQSILKSTSFEVNVSNPSGAPLSQAANGTANTELIFNLHSTQFLDVREVGGNVYLKIDITALASIPGTNISSSQAAAAQTFLGGRWFELPKGLLTSLIKKSRAPKAQIAEDQKVEAKVIDALTTYIDAAHYKTLANGFSVSGSLQSVVAAVEPTIQQLAHSTSAPKPQKGSFTLVLTTSGSTVTGGSISITAPNGTKGNATGTVVATVSHDAVNVTAPSGATKITPQLLASLGLSSALG